MKKYAKLLCAVLVLSILCCSLIFVSSAEDEETEAFKKSFEVTDYDNANISDGKDVARYDVENNILTSISTGNNTNAPYIGLGKVKGDNPYLVGYAKEDKNEKITSNNHLFIQGYNDLTAPFTVVGSGTKGYYVIDFDVATHGNMFPDFDVQVVMRRASDSKGSPFSGQIPIGHLIKELDSWSHVTIVGDLVNNVCKVYINGVYVGDSSFAINTNTAADFLSNDTQVKAQGFRLQLSRNNQEMALTKGDNVAFDNLCERLYIENGDALGKALSDGDLTDWADYIAGRGGEALPTLATVDGVEYGNSKSLEKTLSTNDAINVEFLAEPFVPVNIAANAVINTNGMPKSNLFTLVGGCTIKSENENIITTTSPFVSNNEEKHISVSSAAGVVKSDKVKDNLFASFSAVDYGKEIGRSMYQIADTNYINDRFNGYNGDNINAVNSWFAWNPSKKIAYVTGADQHIVIDFDMAKNDSLVYKFSTITVNSGGTSQFYDAQDKPAPVDIDVDAFLLGYNQGDFVHVTMVLSVDTRSTHIFVNGKYATTISGNISRNTSGYYFGSLRASDNSASNVNFANISIREIRDGELTASVAAADITTWSGNVYDSDYEMPSGPAKVIIDGVPYSSEAEIERALYGNRETPAVVKILHVFEETITVNCNAKIYTYGQDVKFVDIKGRELVPDANSIIRLEIPYMSVSEEKNVELSGGVANSEIFDAIKGKVNGNLFTSFVPSVGNWGMEGYRNASLLTNIENYDVMYRDSAILNSNGAMNGDSAEYVDMKFKAIALNGAVGKNEYIVVDFDFGTDRELVDDVFVQLVTSAGDVLNSISLKDLDVFAGDMAHVTVVYDFTRDVACVFVNGIYACMADGLSGGANVTVDSFRLAAGGKTSPVCLDNVAVRYFAYADAEDQLQSAIDSNRLTSWSDNIYTSEYKVSKLPTLAIVTVTENGEEFVKEYGSIDALNKFLSIDADYKKVVVIKYAPKTSVNVRTEVTVDTNGLDIDLDWNTGLYEFDPGVERYRGTKTGLAYATSKFIYTTVGTAYNFQIIDADNCFSNASVAIWAGGITRRPEVKPSDYDVVFYSYGEEMAPITDNVYVEGDKKYTLTWSEVTITGKNSVEINPISEYAMASSSQTMKIYVYEETYNNASNYAINNMLYASNIGTDIIFTLYVEKTNSLVTDTGRVVNIDGTDYMAFDYYLAPHEIDKVITVSFEVKNGSNVYIQYKDICYLDYIRKLLETTDFDKALIVSLLDYANKAHVLFNNTEMSAVTELINKYSEFLPNEEIKEAVDTSSLKGVIRSVALRLNSTPEVVFKVARGFKGTIAFYNRFGNEIESFDVNALASEQIITLDGLYICDFAEDLTIKVTGSSTCEGMYNLSTYAHSLENNDFAVALYNYALCAVAYKGNVENLPVD